MPGYLDMSGNRHEYLHLYGSEDQEKKLERSAAERPMLPTPSDHLTSNSPYSTPYAHIRAPLTQVMEAQKLKVYENMKDEEDVVTDELSRLAISEMRDETFICHL